VAVAKRRSRPAAKAERGKDANAKKSKTYRLSEAKIAAAQQILGTRTATAAIEAALDLVVFRKELVDGTAALLGTELAPFDRG
jgi:hypothetical protein